MSASGAQSAPPAGGAPPDAPASRPLRAALELARWIEGRGDRGHDPFDLLASPRVRRLALGSRWLGVAWTQLGRRAPVQLRGILGVPPLRNPKGMGLTLEAHLRLGDATGQARHRIRSDALGRDLLELQADTGGWGYPFPWANRDFFAPAGTPSSVATAFVGEALLAWRDRGGAAPDGALEAAGSFLAGELNRIPGPGGTFCFSYTPLDGRAVHNASVLAASLLARLWALTGRGAWREAAEAALAFTVQAQRRDGSWPYGTTARNRWTDPYHTGYILLALRTAGEALGSDAYQDAVARGYAYWRDAFFHPPAVGPRPGRSHPVETHAVAQAILTLLAFRWDDPGALPEARRLARWSLEHLKGRAPTFHHARHRRRVNRLVYLRWDQAWMLRALAELAAVEAETPSPPARGA